MYTYGMNDIAFGIFCFGEDRYIIGAQNKVKNLLNNGFYCYVLTDSPEKFDEYTSSMVTIVRYCRTFKSYSDKMILPKHILRKHDIAILLDADSPILDYSILEKLKKYKFKHGISYIDTILNHRARREFVKELIDFTQLEWEPYVQYAKRICPDFGDFEAMWEYFIVINKEGFNEERFYYHYERLQLMKEYSDLPRGKKVNGAGEGISIQISSKMSNTEIQRDIELYNILSEKIHG